MALSNIQRICDHIALSHQALTSIEQQADKVETIISSLERVVRQGGAIYTCGNGGSACEAMHLTEELVARYKMHRPGIKAYHLCDPGTLTCWANDYSFDDVFARQVETLVEKRDALVALSSSGNSPNLIKALEVAKTKGALSIALLGKDGGLALNAADIAIVVGSNHTAQVQESQLTIIHIICSELETRLFGDS